MSLEVSGCRAPGGGQMSAETENTNRARRRKRAIQRLGGATINKISVAIIKSGIPVPPLTKRTAIVVEHNGRRSGNKYSTPMGYVKASDDRLHVVAEHGDRSDWVRNALVGPVALWIDGRRFDATARMRPDLDPNRVWRAMNGRVVVAFAKLLAHEPQVVELQMSEPVTL